MAAGRRRRGQGLRLRAAHGHPGDPAGRRHQPQRPGARATGSWSTCAATWPASTVEDDGARARVKPGTLLGHANRVLAPHGRKLGPDPASTDIACVGGVIANNSGGMRCGVDRRLLLHRPLADLRAALGDRDRHRGARRGGALRRRRAGAGRGPGARSATRSAPTPSCRERIRTQVRDQEHDRLPALRLPRRRRRRWRSSAACWSAREGTLAFVAEAVFETVPLPPRTTISWLHFDGIEAATEPVPDFVAAGATAVELMVAPALMVASQNIAGAPAGLDGAAAGVGGAAGRVRRRRPTPSWTRWSRGRSRRSLGREPDPARRLHPRPGAGRGRLDACARACTG